MLICELPSWPAAFVGLSHRWIFLLSASCGPLLNIYCGALQTIEMRSRGAEYRSQGFLFSPTSWDIFQFLVVYKCELKGKKSTKSINFEKIIFSTTFLPSDSTARWDGMVVSTSATQFQVLTNLPINHVWSRKRRKGSRQGWCQEAQKSP